MKKQWWIVGDVLGLAAAVTAVIVGAKKKTKAIA